MVFELVIAAYIVEGVRGGYYWWKECNRNERALNRFGEILKTSKGWDDLSAKLYADKDNDPKLYAKIPQTWMYRLYWRLKGE